MKRFLILFLLPATLLTACRTSDSRESEVDIRDQYVGTYDVVFRNQTKVGSIIVNEEAGKGTITITKSEAPREVYIQNQFPGNSEKYTAELEGNRFRVIDKTTDELVLGPRTYTGAFTITGEFVRDSIRSNLDIRAQQDNLTISKVGTAKGPRK